MQVKIQLDSSCEEPLVIIRAARLTDELRTLAEKLSGGQPQPLLTGSLDGELKVLREEELIRVYASGGRVFAVTDKGEYTLRLRLYEAEARLDPRWFVRISNSEIVNLKKAESFDLGLTGTICVRLANGQAAYVSRRYLARVKKTLGI